MVFTTPHSAPPLCGDAAVDGAFSLLDSLQIPYAWVSHTPAYTMEDCDAISAALEISICKNLFLCNRQKTAFYLLTMPANKPFVSKDVSHQLGSSRLSFAPEELMADLIGCNSGSASILGLAYDRERKVQLVMDRAVCDAPWFGCHPCNNAYSLRMSTHDVLEKLLPAMGHTPVFVE